MIKSTKADELTDEEMLAKDAKLSRNRNAMALFSEAVTCNLRTMVKAILAILPNRDIELGFLSILELITFVSLLNAMSLHAY